ncbi:MAG: B12-binding domain-containing radical SAM protein [Candidatus Aminicenantes bacterium]|nr:B12-binding domain-containing radical SAM protein [Candidatus Aminicenantes bacterium]
MSDGSAARGRKVLLIFPPMQEYIYGPQWRPTESPTAPLGLMSLATPLIKAGYQVDFIDFTVDKLDQEGYLEALQKADFILISCYSQALGNISKIIRDVRLIHEDAAVLCGGPHCNETEMHVEGSDITVYGEADHVIVQILERVSSKGPLDNIPGISYDRDGQIVRNPGFHVIEDLDALEFPSFHLARKKKYGYLYGLKFDHIVGLMTSRGCPFRCTFCTFRRTKFRERSVDNVILEIQRRVEEGAKYIVFFDDNFLLRRTRTVQIMDEIIKRRFPVRFAIQGRVDLADDDLYGKFKKAGVIIMIFGVESANQDVLDFYKKDTTVQNIRRAITLADQWGLITFGTLIVGAPMENYGHFEADKQFFREVPLDVASIHILNYCCGSSLWADACEKGLIDRREIHVAADKRLSNFSTEELAGVQKELIRAFYNDPKRILRLLHKLAGALGARFVFKLMKMYLRRTVYRSSDTFHGAAAKNVRV